MMEGVKATAVFSRARPFSYETTIPTGSIIAAGALRFQTTALGSIPAGEKDSGAISAIAESVGERHNVGAGMIKTIVSTPPADIVSVSNPASASGGAENEAWSDYIARFSDYILGLSHTNLYGFRSALMASGLARSLSIEEHFPPVDGIWNMTVYLEDGSGGMTSGALDEAKRIIDGEGSPTGGYRAPGVNIRYLTPEIVPVSIKLKVTADRDVVNELDQSVIVAEIEEAVKRRVNALEIGQSFWNSDLVVALKRITHLLDVDVEEPGDIEISPRHIARFVSCEVAVAVK